MYRGIYLDSEVLRCTRKSRECLDVEVSRISYNIEQLYIKKKAIEGVNNLFPFKSFPLKV